MEKPKKIIETNCPLFFYLELKEKKALGSNFKLTTLQLLIDFTICTVNRPFQFEFLRTLPRMTADVSRIDSE